jgi:diguanylate cyclase (GGDEF)-like protein
MKVGETGRSSGPVSVRRARARAGAQETAPVEPRKVADTVSIMGIPEVELMPKVRAAIVTLMAEVESLRHEVEHTRERLAHLERLADQDPLAPIANRRAFVRELSRAISITERYGTPSSLVYFDVNGLKEINDTYGHTAGDEGLLRVASILREHVRDVDVVGRLGGDEFGVIMVQTELEPAFDKARRLAAAIRENPFSWDGHDIALEVAHGVYAFKAGESVNDALAAADRAMYEQKLASKAAAG